MSITPLELVLDPWIFSQMPLLTPSEFASEARDRDTNIKPRHLEALHASARLIPLLRVAKSQSDENPQFTPTSAVELARFRKLGRVFDAQSEDFVPWSDFEVRDKTGTIVRRTSEFLYSRYQLIGIRRLGQLRHRFASADDGDPIVAVLDDALGVLHCLSRLHAHERRSK